MARLDARLLKIITNENCFLLLGSGLSINSGYPSWRNMAFLVLEEIKNKISDDYYLQLKSEIVSNSTEKLLSFFSKIEKKIGKEELVLIVKSVFDAIHPKDNEYYMLVAQWPINCYLTTNYDSELLHYLEKLNLSYIEKTNSENDFRNLTSDTKKTIFKIHGDFSTPQTMIISQADYDCIMHSPIYEYWRKKIESILYMNNLVLIGYSARDPNFQELLLKAQNFSNPSKPIFMFASDFSAEEILDLRSRFNIQVIPYDNSDGKHTGLKKLLKIYSKFIPKRNDGLLNRTDEQIQDSELATSIYIYKETVFSDSDLSSKALFNSVLFFLMKQDIKYPEFIRLFRKKQISSDEQSLKRALDVLVQKQFVNVHNDCYSITEKGKKLFTEAKSSNDEIKLRFTNWCKIYLKNKGYATDSLEKIIETMDVGLNVIFEKRGVEIARKIFLDDDSDISVAFDLAIALGHASKLLSDNEYNGFIDLILSIIQNPAEEARNYLAILCNGYFTYHFLGHDKEAKKQRLSIIKECDVFIDTNVLLPAIAKFCQNHDYTIDLIERIQKENSAVYITENILQEVVDHATWAIKYYEDKKIDDIALFQAAEGDAGYRQNLFVQAGLFYMQKEGYTNFSSYLDDFFGEEYRDTLKLHDSIAEKICKLNIRIIDKEECIDNFSDTYYPIFEKAFEEIKTKREGNNTYRNELQCKTEAELLAISTFKKIIFLTMTSNLKRIGIVNKMIHASPESIYRFLKMNDNDISLDNMYNCMISDIYNCGFSVINRELLERIASPIFHQAELRLSEIKKSQNNDIKVFLSKNLIDESKENMLYPYFVAQIQNKLNESIKNENMRNEQQLRELAKKEKEIELSQKERTKLARYESKKKLKMKKQKNKRNKKR